MAELKKTLYGNVEIVDMGISDFRQGELIISLPSLIWRRYKTIVMNIPDMDKVTWMKMEEESIKFDFHMKKDGVKHQFTGFTPDDLPSLVDLLNTQGISTHEELRVVTGQISASLIQITENSLILKVNPVNTLYETPLTDVIDIETMGKNVQLSFHIDDTFGATQADRMMDMTFSIPNTFSQFCGVKGSTPAIEFKKKVMSMDCVRLGGKDPVATFERLIFLSPRGAYDMHINLQFFGLKNDDTAVTLLYRSIVSMHILPKLAKDKPDPSPQVYVVICVDPPLQMDENMHPYLVMMLNNTEDVKKPVEIQMKDELYASKFKDKLKKSYEGRVHEIVVSILEGLSGKKHSEIGEYGHGVWSILKAAHQSKRGSLYPLEDAFYFLSDPVTRIFYNDIKNVEIEGPEDGSFNLQIILNTERHCFSTLVESELDRLVAFMKVKNMTVNFCEDPVKKSKGFKNFKKTMEKKMEEQFPGESSNAIDRKMKNLWIEASAEEKDLYELTG